MAAMLPKRVKHRKQMRGKMKGHATRGNRVSFGEYGLMSLDYGWINGRHIESGRVAANRATGGAAKIWIRIFPHKPISSKPAETRMGKGKGDVEFWAAVIKPGTILFELGGVSEEVAKLAFKRVAHKMPIKVKMVRRVPTS
ncbi:MAG: large subunit ribosomal protein L16 [Planctomycetota bacterium]|jgi:large subunit ribosomal protein L16